MIKEDRSKFFYGYIIVAVGLSIQLVGLGMYHTYGVFLKSLQAEFDWSRALLAGAHALAFVVGGFLAITSGRMADRFGPRVVMVICGLFLGVGYLLLSRVNAIWQLYLFYSLFVGIGWSALDVVNLSTVARWFVRKRGMMSGITKVGVGLGMLIMPALASRLIPAYGWRTAYIILGSFALVSIVSLAQFLRHDPARMGLLPDGDKKEAASNVDLARSGLSFSEALRSRQFLTWCIAQMTFVYSAQTITTHIAPHAMDIGIPVTEAASLLSVIGAVSIMGRLVMGATSDKIGNKKGMMICFTVMLSSLVWLQFASDLGRLYIFAVFYGFAHGGFFAMVSPTVASIVGLKSHGVLFGVVIFLGNLSGAIGSVMAGHIFDVTGDYQRAFLIMAVLVAFGLTALSTLRVPGKAGGPINT